MSLVEIKIPTPGESITEVTISRWIKQDGEYVEKDDELAEIESDKATLTLNAESSGQLKINVAEGTVAKVGEIACTIDTSVQGIPKSKEEAPKSTPIKNVDVVVKSEPIKVTAASGHPSPAAAKMIAEGSIPTNAIKATGKDGRITKGDVLAAMSAGFSLESNPPAASSRNQARTKMTPLRKKLSQRLVSVKQETAMLTTFNEVDMSAIYALRAKYKDTFKEKHGTNVGFMGFFTKAVCEALRLFPAVNSQINGEEIISHDYADICIAVSAPKGLVVPVIRNAESMSIAQIEAEIKTLALKARENKLTIEEMTGGTFTITNGGVFGSLMSTPIINPPQSAILGMHNVVERPVAINGKVEIRPMMYVALSYDHRIIDGRESVGFLVKVKEMCENPLKLLFGSKAPEEILLGL